MIILLIYYGTTYIFVPLSKSSINPNVYIVIII